MRRKRKRYIETQYNEYCNIIIYNIIICTINNFLSPILAVGWLSFNSISNSFSGPTESAEATMAQVKRTRTIRQRNDEVQEDYFIKHVEKSTPVKKFTIVAMALQVPRIKYNIIFKTFFCSGLQFWGPSPARAVFHPQWP